LEQVPDDVAGRPGGEALLVAQRLASHRDLREVRVVEDDERIDDLRRRLLWQPHQSPRNSRALSRRIRSLVLSFKGRDSKSSFTRAMSSPLVPKRILLRPWRSMNRMSSGSSVDGKYAEMSPYTFGWRHSIEQNSPVQGHPVWDMLIFKSGNSRATSSTSIGRPTSVGSTSAECPTWKPTGIPSLVHFA